MKVFNEQENIGKAKYVVNFHDGIKQHKDCSPFFDIKIFTNKKIKNAFVKTLESQGYKYGSSCDLKKQSVMDNPNRELTGDETIKQLLPLLDSGTVILAINQSETLVLLKDSKGRLETFSYCVSHTNQIENGGWQPKLEHYLRGSTHHTERDFQKLFATKPVGALKAFQSKTDKLFVAVHRVGKRRKMIDEIGNIFVKVTGRYWKFPEQVSY
jgi:hypothetical protein